MIVWIGVGYQKYDCRDPISLARIAQGAGILIIRGRPG